eukprot:scaffold15955_cov78-Skeletonema_dohrnii-CCMP3373.AAC.1
MYWICEIESTQLLSLSLLSSPLGAKMRYFGVTCYGIVSRERGKLLDKALALTKPGQIEM